jgi:hypothetical protein
VALQGVTPLDVEHEVCDVKRYGMFAILHNVKPVLTLVAGLLVLPHVWMPITTFLETLARHGLGGAPFLIFAIVSDRRWSWRDSQKLNQPVTDVSTAS